MISMSYLIQSLVKQLGQVEPGGRGSSKTRESWRTRTWRRKWSNRRRCRIWCCRGNWWRFVNELARVISNNSSSTPMKFLRTWPTRGFIIFLIFMLWFNFTPMLVPLNILVWLIAGPACWCFNDNWYFCLIRVSFYVWYCEENLTIPA